MFPEGEVQALTRHSRNLFGVTTSECLQEVLPSLYISDRLGSTTLLQETLGYLLRFSEPRL